MLIKGLYNPEVQVHTRTSMLIPTQQQPNNKQALRRKPKTLNLVINNTQPLPVIEAVPRGGRLPPQRRLCVAVGRRPWLGRVPLDHGAVPGGLGGWVVD
jgi:hypothetical protein